MMKFRTLTLFEMQLAQRLKELDRFSIRTESVETGQMGTPHSATRKR